MIHLAKSALLKLWLLLLLMIVVSAFLLSTGRLLTPLVADHRSDLERMFSDALGQPVEIGRLAARWRGLGPELVLEQVSVLSPVTGNKTLHIGHAGIQVALLDSLRSISIKPRLITLSGLRLLIRRHPDGTVSVGGLGELDQPGGEVGRLFGLPGKVRLTDSEIFWENQMIGAPPVRFPGVSALFVNDSGRHQLEATLSLPGGGSAHVIGELSGDPGHPGDWSARFYLEGRNLALDELLNRRLPEAYQFRSGNLNLELWGQWDRNRFSELEGEVSLTGLELERVRDTEDAVLESLSLEHLDGQFRWRREAQGWLLQMTDIDVSRGGARWPTGRFAVRARSAGEEGTEYAGGIDFLRLDDVAAVVGILPLPEALEPVLLGIRPQAELHDLRLRLVTGATPRWSARGRIASLYTRPWNRIPGTENLDAAFWMNQDGGTLRLDSEQARLLFPGLFRDPLVLERLGGDLSWERMPQGGWRLSSPWLLAVTPDIRTQTRLEMRFPEAPGASIYMDLQTDFRDGRAANANRYYPVGIMPPAVVRWLDRAIIDGRVTGGSVRVVGPLRDFPFEQHPSGQFQVLFDVADMTLDYWPGWPRLTGVAGRIRFFGNRFDAWVDDGRIFDSRLRQVHGEIAALKGGSPFQLKGQVSGPFGDDLRLLRESPLADSFAHFTSGMGAKGRTRMTLDFAVPLKRGDRFRLDGALHFEESTLLLNDWNLPLEKIRGTLTFDQNSISGRNIRGSAMGSPVRVDLETLKGNPGATRITTSGRFSVGQLTRPFGLDPPAWIRGHSQWRIRIDIPHDQKRHPRPALLRADSDLAGIRIDLPAPLGKVSGARRPFRISTAIGNTTSGRLTASYDDTLAARLDIALDGARSRLRRAGIRLGPGQARLPHRDGIVIEGRLPQLDLGAWAALLEQDTATTAADLPPLRHLRLSLGEAHAGLFPIRHLDLDLTRKEDGLEGSVSAERFRGWLRIPDHDDAPLEARLERLDLNFEPESEMKKDLSPGRRGGGPEPARIPSLDLQVKQVRINGKSFGALRWISRRAGHGLELQHLSLNSDLLHLSAAGQWQRELSGRHRTRIDLSLSTESLGRLSNILRLGAAIDGAPAEMEGRLRWDGSPFDFSLGAVSGELSIQLGQGVLVDTNPGLGRILGLVNVGSLKRRLRLDFSDVLKEGFGFDAIEGSFTLEEGDAYTSDLLIRGPAARIEFVGRIGLRDEDLDQLVTVIPNVSATLPLAGALAGGPVGAAAMLLAQGVLGKQVNRMARRQYRIDGPWENPVIVPIRRGDGTITSDQSAESDSKGLIQDLKQPPKKSGVSPFQTPDR